MNIVANNVASKLFVAFVAVAMLFTLVTPAKAATAAELQQMINDLLAQVASLQGQVGQDSSAPGVRSVCPFTWTRSLNVGATGADVMKLQQFLNSDTDTRVSASGVGSVGAETQYYGPATAAAVSKMQVKYRSDILSPAGLVNPTGFFGPGTMAKANALCVQGAPAGDDTTGDDDMSDDTTSGDDDMSSSDLSGEASLDKFTANDGDDTELEEGQEDAAVADMKVRFSDGDGMVTRMDVILDPGAGNDTKKPWKTFDEVSLWVDGKKVADVDASDKDNYLDDSLAGDAASIRFSGLDLVGMEDEDVVVTVGVTVQSSVDGANDGEDWEVYTDEIRYIDGSDVTTTDDSTDDIGTDGKVNFSIDSEGVDDELVVKSSTSDPDATTLELQDDAKSDWQKIFVWDLDTNDSVNDITVNDIVVDVTLSSSTYDHFVSDAKLVVDGDTFDNFDYTDGATASLDFDVSDDDLVIAAGDKVSAELWVKFKALSASLDEGTTISATTDADDYDAEGADDLTASGPDQLQGTADSEEHTLRTEGATIELTDSSQTLKTNSDATTTDDEGVFTLEFDVTAFNGDLYIDDIATRGVTLTNGVNFVVLTGGATTTAGTDVATLDSDAELTGGKFLVRDGETESFTLTVEYDPATSASYKAQLYSVNFKVDSNAPADTMQLANPGEDFDTASLTI